jgi:hypothetical protein
MIFVNIYANNMFNAFVYGIFPTAAGFVPYSPVHSTIVRS